MAARQPSSMGFYIVLASAPTKVLAEHNSSVQWKSYVEITLAAGDYELRTADGDDVVGTYTKS